MYTRLLKKLILVLALLSPVLTAYPQQADAVLGEWVSEKKTGRILVFRKGNHYFGRLSWLDDNAVLDAYNPDPSQRSRQLVGAVILTDFTFKNNRWEDGQIYDPESGRTYACTMQTTDTNNLKIRGYIGFSLLGRTSTWKRFKPQ